MPGSGNGRIGPYRILRQINRGGQGSVYLGFDDRLRRRVAIKVYGLPSRRSARRRLLREARLLAGIRSPKVVQLYDVIESTGHMALVMEYVPGCDLEEFLAREQPSLASVLTISADIAGALAAARQQGIVHGDLKARNVLVTESGRARLTDFGIARHASERDAVVSDAVSPSALSPEQLQGLPLDVRSDLFALGRLMYRMLSGHHPFQVDGRFDDGLLLAGSPRPLREVVPPRMELPPALDQLVHDLLQADPRDRPNNTHHVRQVLRALAAEMPLAVRNSLLRQARPHFRPESADDIPPLVPPDLLRTTRSSLSPRLLPWQQLWPVNRYAGIGVGVALFLFAALLLYLVQPRGEVPVHIGEPMLRLEAGVELPRGLSRDWLVAQVRGALDQRLGGVHVTGPFGERGDLTLYLDGEGISPPPPALERVAIELRCPESFCVLDVIRERQGERGERQAVLFPDMSLERWGDIVRATTAALYP